MRELCPNCLLRTVVHKHCVRCGGSFGTGYIVNRRRQPEPTYVLPSSREIFQRDYPRMFRDSGPLRGPIIFGKLVIERRRRPR